MPRKKKREKNQNDGIVHLSRRSVVFKLREETTEENIETKIVRQLGQLQRIPYLVKEEYLRLEETLHVLNQQVETVEVECNAVWESRGLVQVAFDNVYALNAQEIQRVYRGHASRKKERKCAQKKLLNKAFVVAYAGMNFRTCGEDIRWRSSTVISTAWKRNIPMRRATRLQLKSHTGAAMVITTFVKRLREHAIAKKLQECREKEEDARQRLQKSMGQKLQKSIRDFSLTRSSISAFNEQEEPPSVTNNLIVVQKKASKKTSKKKVPDSRPPLHTTRYKQHYSNTRSDCSSGTASRYKLISTLSNVSNLSRKTDFSDMSLTELETNRTCTPISNESEWSTPKPPLTKNNGNTSKMMRDRLKKEKNVLTRKELGRKNVAEAEHLVQRQQRARDMNRSREERYDKKQVEKQKLIRKKSMDSEESECHRELSTLSVREHALSKESTDMYKRRLSSNESFDMSRRRLSRSGFVTSSPAPSQERRNSNEEFRPCSNTSKKGIVATLDESNKDSTATMTTRQVILRAEGDVKVDDSQEVVSQRPSSEGDSYSDNDFEEDST